MLTQIQEFSRLFQCVLRKESPESAAVTALGWGWQRRPIECLSSPSPPPPSSEVCPPIPLRVLPSPILVSSSYPLGSSLSSPWHPQSPTLAFSLPHPWRTPPPPWCPPSSPFGSRFPALGMPHRLTQRPPFRSLSVLPPPGDHPDPALEFSHPPVAVLPPFPLVLFLPTHRWAPPLPSLKYFLHPSLHPQNQQRRVASRWWVMTVSRRFNLCVVVNSAIKLLKTTERMRYF